MRCGLHSIMLDAIMTAVLPVQAHKLPPTRSTMLGARRLHTNPSSWVSWKRRCMNDSEESAAFLLARKSSQNSRLYT